MPDPYQELDVFGRPKSRVDGVPYVAFDDDLAALQNYVLNLRAKEEAIESGVRTPRRVKEIVREGGRLPGYVHPYEPGYVVQEQERLRDETDPVQFLPIVRQGVENVRAIYNEGPETPEYIDAKLFGQRAPQYLNTLGSQVRKGGPGFEARFGEWQDPWVTGGDPALRGSLTGRTQMWPEKMARSGASLPGDVMSGKVMTGPGLRATDFSDIPGAPNPLAPLIERTQDLAGLAMGGSIPELAARGVDRNALGSGFVPKEKIVDAAIQTDKGVFRGSTHATATVRAEEAGVDINKLNLDNADGFITSTGRFVSREEAAKIADEAGQRTSNTPRLESGQVTYPFEKDLTQGSFGGNVPPSVARNIGRETMPEILARQRASEGYEAAIRDSETKKVTTGMWHEEVIDKIAKERGIPRDEVNLLVSSPDKGNLVKGYVDYNGKFWTEAQMERKSQSRTAMFRADDEVGAAVAAMHATEGKAPELKVGLANLPAVIPQGGAMTPGSAINPISNRRGFLRGARDLMAAASNANKIVTMAEKLGQTPIPKNPKVPLKEIWKTEGTGEIPAEIHKSARENFWEGFRQDFEDRYPEFEGGHIPPGKEKTYDRAVKKFEKEHAESIDDITAELFADHSDREGGTTQFFHHQLPGATNYREHLMQMPEREFVGHDTIKRRNEQQPFYGDWDEPDIIGHSRVNDRQIPGVGRALHIEEIGSQLHDYGSKKGYGKPDISKWRIERDEKGRRSVYDQSGEHIGGEDKFTGALTDEQLKKQLVPTLRTAPDVPFKKTYVDLAVNRMLHEAATQGYDAVSWTPHELQKKNYGGDSNKEILPRIEALAKKYGGKVEKHKVETGSDKDGKSVTEDVYHVKLTPEMKRIFGHEDFSFFPKPETGGGFKLRSDSEAGAAIGALRNSVAPTFYSGLSRTIERVPFETATPSQWMKHLRDTVGARQAEEFEHVGLEGRLGPLAEVKAPVERKAQAALEEWKATNKGQRPPRELTDAASNENKRIVEQRLAEKGNEKPLTKAELLAHVASNQPKFKEIVKRGDQDDSEAAIHRRAEEIIDEQQIHPDHPRYADYFAEATHQAEDELINSGQQAKYSDYQLPGGTNYREHLMTIPDRQREAAETFAKAFYNNTKGEGARNWEKLSQFEKQEWINAAAEQQKMGRGREDYHSSHWDEPNVIVHTRMNDRNLEQPGFVVQNRQSGNKSQVFGTREEAQQFLHGLPETMPLDIRDGNKTLRSLHAEEFQSDLHQEGRKKGYKTNKPEEPIKRKLTAEEARRIGLKEGDEQYVVERNGQIIGAGDTPQEAKQYAATATPAVPNFPFKKSWPDLAIKRWLREAADNDYDAVSWTPGEAQRDRFQLGHAIENLHYAKNRDNTYSLSAEKKNGGGIININRGLPIKESELSSHVGDAVAEKIKKGEGKEDSLGLNKILENQDLKVGGEGLVSFYDKTIKGKVEALVEKFGGKVEKHKIKVPYNEGVSGEMIMADLGVPRRRQPDYWRNLSQQERDDLLSKYRSKREGEGFVWSVKLTPEMKRAIRSEGFPLFTAGPVMTPVDHDPFDKKQKPKPKLEPVEHDPFAQPTPDLGGTLNKLISATGGYRPRPRPIQNGFGRRQ